MAGTFWPVVLGVNVMYETRTSTATYAQAKQLGAIVRMELTQMRAFYKAPSAEMLEKLVTEFETLVSRGYLEKVQYGFKRNGLIVFQLEYTASSGGLQSDRPGRVPATLDLEGASWFSFLTTSVAFRRLSTKEQADFEATLPLQRTPAETPSLASGVYFGNAKTYSTEDLGVSRRIFQA